MNVALTFLWNWPNFFQNWPNFFNVLFGKQFRGLATLPTDAYSIFYIYKCWIVYARKNRWTLFFGCQLAIFININHLCERKHIQYVHICGMLGIFYIILCNLKQGRPSHCKKSCAKFRCGQRWREPNDVGYGKFLLPRPLVLRHHCQHRNLAPSDKAFLD